MRRLKRLTASPERGATAVIVGILLVTLVGFGAIAVDVGALYWDRKQLQNGADAGALAVAQTCAKAPSDLECAKGASTTPLAQGNKVDGNATGEVVALTDNSVTVETNSTRQLWLARVLGFDSAPVAAQATASWGAVGGGNTIPLTIAKCAFDPEKLDQATGWVHLETKSPGGFNKDEDPCAPDAKAPQVIPGGFHWLNPTSGCSVITSAGDNAPSDPGNDGPDKSQCTAKDLNDILQSGSVFIPIFDHGASQGKGGTYHLVGYAHFTPTAYCLTGGNPAVAWNTTKCTGSERWIEGYFVKAVSLDATLDPSAPDFGTKTVKLTA